ncbi:TlpA disulfide reductase family protein [Pedobacter sp. Leaf176]|uniref:TlpA family protein disulfide reductase n=1 Tax=Pedobacter sp. Leaf176 TaxID=1736286 RepID=UPI0006FF0692|nr:TlpA disulfide reductase family protein [Pedobacter sp. Leaf176]KQR69538.1 hypothetical protein ASF92_12490 [Pedobacter sp. Leaf176]
MKTTFKKPLLAFSVLILVIVEQTEAQMLLKSSDKITASKNLSYTDIVETKFSFQDQFNGDTIKSMLSPSVAKTHQTGKYILEGKRVKYAFDGTKLVTLHYGDSTYTVQKEPVSGQDTRTLLYWSDKMSKLNDVKNKAISISDTMINGYAFTNIKVTEKDKIDNEQHQYIIYKFILNKKTLLPIKIISMFKGKADDGSDFGLVEIHNYSNYKINQVIFPDLSSATIPNYFRLPKKREPVKFLENGSLAPPLNAVDLKGLKLNNETYKGKVVLMNFSLIGCPHCVGAAQMLNRLHKKFLDSNFIILNIYPIDTSEIIARFDHKENVLSSSFTSDRSVQKSYPFDGYPSFYLVDSHGKIVQSYNGYYKELEAQLEKKIAASL